MNTPMLHGTPNFFLLGCSYLLCDFSLSSLHYYPSVKDTKRVTHRWTTLIFLRSWQVNFCDDPGALASTAFLGAHGATQNQSPTVLFSCKPVAGLDGAHGPHTATTQVRRRAESTSRTSTHRRPSVPGRLPPNFCLVRWLHIEMPAEDQMLKLDSPLL